MCKSQADGGQRCAAHTRRAFESVRMYHGHKWDEAAAQYASTREGQEVLQATATEFAAAGHHEQEARARAALKRGLDIRDANTDAAAEIAKRDLTKWEPVSIDDELARLYGEAYQEAADLENAEANMTSVANRAAGRRSWDSKSIRKAQIRAEIDELVTKHDTDPNEHTEKAVKALRDYNDLMDNYNSIVQAREPYEKEFTRRGGWTRAFLVVSSAGGHVHKDMNCGTCRSTTQFNWVTEFSAKPESEIVEAAGERACTQCYPSAPVEVLDRPTRIFSPEEREQQAAREQRATAAQERDAKKIANALTPDGSEFKVECTRLGYTQRERFKTERAATTWMVGNIAYFNRDWNDFTMDPSMHEAHERIIAAIAAKHGKSAEDVRADIDKKVRAKMKRDD